MNENNAIKTAGEIITWNASGGKFLVAAVRAGLAAGGFEEKLCRDMLPRNAFARACRKMADERIIRMLIDAGGVMKFQFTAEQRDGDGYRYDREDVVVLDKLTGAVTCDENPSLADRAKKLIDAETASRGAFDVTKLIQKLFDREKGSAADLFQLRDQGGCYFVPAAGSAFLDRIATFCEAVGVRVSRFPVVSGTSSADRSIADTVTDGLNRMIDEHFDAVETFDFDTRASTFERHVQRIQLTRTKLECYAEMLDHRRLDMLDRIEKASRLLKAKIRRSESGR